MKLSKIFRKFRKFVDFMEGMTNFELVMLSISLLIVVFIIIASITSYSMTYESTTVALVIARWNGDLAAIIFIHANLFLLIFHNDCMIFRPKKVSKQMEMKR